MLIRSLTDVDGVPLFLCAPGLTPEFQLYDMLPDGTKRYLVNLAPWRAEPEPTGQEVLMARKVMDEQAIERIADKEPVRVDRITEEDVAAAAMLCFVDAQHTLHLAAEDWFPPYETEAFSAEIIKANAFWEVALSATQAVIPYMESDKEWELAVERRLMLLYKDTKERYLIGEPARWVAGDVDGA